MGRKVKYSAEQKIAIVEEYLRGEGSYPFLEKKYGIHSSIIAEWVIRYEVGGPLVFLSSEHNMSYSEEFKLKAVQAYLTGEGWCLTRL